MPTDALKCLIYIFYTLVYSFTATEVIDKPKSKSTQNAPSVPKLTKNNRNLEYLS